MNFPPEFDLCFYQETYADLQGLDADALRHHYQAQGIGEGRWGTAVVAREHFLDLAIGQGSVLEIGPFFAPALLGDHVRYFDVLDRDGLMARADKLNQPPDRIPEVIHYVSSNGDLGTVDDRFDAVFSSHCIEHQPNLIKHLHDIERILNDGGSYFLIVPDKRYCFDHYIPPSSTADVLDANDSRTAHSLGSVVLHRSQITHNDPVRHWEGDHGELPANNTATIAAALQEYEASAGQYIDVHAWQFEPEPFRAIMTDLNGLGFTNLTCDRVYQTPRGRFEFCAVLSKPTA